MYFITCKDKGKVPTVSVEIEDFHFSIEHCFVQVVNNGNVLQNADLAAHYVNSSTCGCQDS